MNRRDSVMSVFLFFDRWSLVRRKTVSNLACWGLNACLTVLILDAEKSWSANEMRPSE